MMCFPTSKGWVSSSKKGPRIKLQHSTQTQTLSCPYTKDLSFPFPPVSDYHDLHRLEQERIRKSVFEEIDFVKQLGEKLAPPKASGGGGGGGKEMSEGEKKMVEELGKINGAIGKRDRAEELKEAVEKARMEGVREGREGRNGRGEELMRGNEGPWGYNGLGLGNNGGNWNVMWLPHPDVERMGERDGLGRDGLKGIEREMGRIADGIGLGQGLRGRRISEDVSARVERRVMERVEREFDRGRLRDVERELDRDRFRRVERDIDNLTGRRLLDGWGDKFS